MARSAADTKNGTGVDNVTEPKEIKSQIPKFRSLEEEAAFWDIHSPLDYPNEWTEAKKRAKTGRGLGHILAVRLDARTLDKLAVVGRRKGVGPSTLVRMWVMERLADLEEQEQRQSARQAAGRK